MEQREDLGSANNSNVKIEIQPSDKDGTGNWGATNVFAVNNALTVATTTKVTASPNSSVNGQSVNFVAKVAAKGRAAATLTGTVTFKDGATVLGTYPVAKGRRRAPRRAWLRVNTPSPLRTAVIRHVPAASAR